MILVLKNVLNQKQIDALASIIACGKFVAGEETAGWHAQAVKSNLQWQGNETLSNELSYCLAAALNQHKEFASATYAKNMMPFVVSKTCLGGGYGDHIDDALMHNDGILRTDISCTTFLSTPDSYEGGELVINIGGVNMQYKLDAGDAIIYPSTTLHRVNPVTQGERLAALTWIESHVNAADKREILYDLDRSRRLTMQKNGKDESFDLMTKTHANMLRRWAVT